MPRFSLVVVAGPRPLFGARNHTFSTYGPWLDISSNKTHIKDFSLDQKKRREERETLVQTYGFIVRV
jgi:hypothetical protein